MIYGLISKNVDITSCVFNHIIDPGNMNAKNLGHIKGILGI